MATNRPARELPQDEIEGLQEELLEAATNTLNLFAIHLGHRLGYYGPWPSTTG